MSDTVWTKFEIAERVLVSLYDAPRGHVLNCIERLVASNANEFYDGWTPNRTYMVCFEGENYFSRDLSSPNQTVKPWEAIQHELHESLQPELRQLASLSAELEHERSIVKNYLTQILNCCENNADAMYLMPKNIHDLLHLKPTQEGPTVDFDIKNQVVRPGYDSLINERLLTNLLIRSL